MNYFYKHKVMTTFLALALCVTTTNFACNTQAWLDTIGKYLPIAIQIATNIINLIGVINPGATTAEDQAAVKAIGDEAVQDVQLLQKLYNEYKANPTPDAKAAIENVLATITTNLPAELQAFHIKNSALQQSVVTAVNLVVTIADIIIAQIPVTNPQLVARKAKMKGFKRPAPESFKVSWDTLVCQGNTACTALIH